MPKRDHHQATPLPKLEAKEAHSDEAKPWQFAVFETCRRDAPFTPLEWEEWMALLLEALSGLGEIGYRPPFDVPRGMISKRADGGDEPPVIRMLVELEKNGHVVFDDVKCEFRITPEGEAYRASIFR